MPTPPVNDPAERQKALEIALNDRRYRAEIKEAVRTGERSFSDVLKAVEFDPKATGRIKVVDLVEALPDVGPVRGAEILAACDVNPSDRLNRLGVHQIAKLSELLG